MHIDTTACTDGCTKKGPLRRLDKFGCVSLRHYHHSCRYEQSISGQSYFDRLWSRGVSRHADQSRRWFICLRRVSTLKQQSPANNASGSSAGTTSKATALSARERSAEKSARRSRQANDRSDDSDDSASSGDSDSESVDGRHNFSNGATVNRDQDEHADDDHDDDFDAEDFEGLPKIDYEALERKIQELEAADAAEKAKTTKNVEAQLKAQRQSTQTVDGKASAEPAHPTSAAAAATPKSSAKAQKAKSAPEVSKKPTLTKDELVTRVKKNNNAWKSWLKSSGNRSASGADPKKYPENILQMFVEQL